MNSPTKRGPQAAPNVRDSVFHDAIAARAYGKWVRRGRPAGTRLKDWQEAEVEVKEAYIGASIEARRRLVAEHAVTRILSESSEILDAASGIVEAICDSLGWDIGIIWMVDRQAQVLRCVDVWRARATDVSAFEQLSRQSAFALGDELPGSIWAGDSPAWIADITRDPYLTRATIAAGEGLHAACGFPIHNGVEFLGVMEFFSRQVHQPNDDILEMMVSIGSQISQFIERRRAEQIVRDRDREFALARKIQQGLLPKTMPALAGFAFGGASQFCQETGGDYYDVFLLPDSNVGIAIGDASGHGIVAALVMEETRASIRALSLTRADPGTILTLTNRCLNDDLPEDQFVTLFLARLDPGTRSLVYSNAGHCPAYVLDQHGEVRLILDSTGIPLGLDLASDFPTAAAVALEPGELLFLVSDGLAEARSPEELPFGMQHALGIVRAHRDQAPDEIVQSLFRAVREYRGNQDQLDDITAVIVKVEGDV